MSQGPVANAAQRKRRPAGVSGFARGTSRTAPSHRRVRHEALDDLLAGLAPATGARLAAAHAAGLQERSRCIVAVAVPTSPVGDPETLRLAIRPLARALGGVLAPLAAVRPGEVVLARALTGAVPRAQLERSQATLASEGIPLAIGLSTPHERPAELADAYREACFALATLGAAGGVAALEDLSPLDCMVLRGDPLVERLLSPQIRRFVAADVARGGLLTSTVVAYADADLNLTAAAEQLFIHLNTARYRLRRVAEETGCDLRRLRDVLDLVIAIKLASR